MHIRFHPGTQLYDGQYRPVVRISVDARMRGAKYANVVYGEQTAALAHAVSAARQVVLEGIEGADCVTLVGRED